VALVRVYCGVAAAEMAPWLTVAVVDDSGRLLDMRHISDDPAGYAYLGALLADRSGGAAPVAMDRHDHLVAQLLAAANRPLAITDEASLADFAERFADDTSYEETQAPVSQRCAVGLARALQAGALYATAQSPSWNLDEFKPVLAAHAAVTAGRQAAAAALREVLRELYPAALRAYPDPAEYVPLKVLEALPEPGLLSASPSSRTRETALISELSSSGVADTTTAVSAITALRVAVEESPRWNSNRALASVVAETVRQSVAAVRACDSASAALIATLVERLGAMTGSTPMPVPSMNGQAAPVSPAVPRRAFGPAAEVPASRISPRVSTASAAAAGVPAVAPVIPIQRSEPAYPEPAYTGSSYGEPAYPRQQTGYGDSSGYSSPVYPASSYPEPAYPEPAYSAASYNGANGASGYSSTSTGTGDYPTSGTGSYPTSGTGGYPTSGTGGYSTAGTGTGGYSTTTDTGGYSATTAGTGGYPATTESDGYPGYSGTEYGGSGNGYASSPSSSNGYSTSPSSNGYSSSGYGETGSSYDQQRYADAATAYAAQKNGRSNGNGNGTSGYGAQGLPAGGLPAHSFGDSSAAEPGYPTPGVPAPGSRSNWPLSPNHEDEFAAVYGGARGGATDDATSTTLAFSMDPLNGPIRGAPGASEPQSWQGGGRSDPPPLRLVDTPRGDPLTDPISDRPSLRLIDGGGPASPAQRSNVEDTDLLIFAQTQSSAWFTMADEAAAAAEEPSWGRLADEGWRAAEQLSRPAVGVETRAGLPRRVPQANLVPGSAAEPQRPLRIVRDAQSIAAHTSGYFRGWQRGQEIGGYAVGQRDRAAWEFNREQRAREGADPQRARMSQ
jgi:hypothetical protein